ncbi:MAG: alpha-glucosidase [Proteobacteria bacterium]|nr:alpha-glucosidase [Pseudomonadota bacterium]
MSGGNEWWRGAVMYQIYPRSFCDSNGDGIGDLNGITSKLDYIASLGVDGVWISPFYTSPMADFGYDVADYCSIDPIFGTLEDFDALLNGLHKRGLKLIIDLVLNHTSEQHPWFTESRKDKTNSKADWYVWTDPRRDGTPPNNWLSVFGGPAWQYDSRRGQYYFHQFLQQQPDLNIRNHEVQDELLRIAEWWLKRGVDGFRLDALNHCIHDERLRDNPPREDIDRTKTDRQMHPYYWQRHLYDKTQPEMIPFIKRLRQLTDRYPERMMVGEIGDDQQNKTSVAYTNGPEMLHTSYSFALLGPDIYAAKKLRAIIEDYFKEPGDSWPSWAFSNHDVRRVATRWGVNGQPDTRQVKMLIALLTSLRGTAFLYEGEELGLGEADIPFEKLQDPFGIFLWPEDKGRDGCRTPMPWNGTQKNAGFSTAPETWLPIPPEHLTKSVADGEKEAKSPLHFTRNFLKWRKTYPVLKTGKLSFLDAPEPALAFKRIQGNDTLFCIFNLGVQPVTLPLPAGCAPLEGHGLPFSLKNTMLTLPGFGGFFGKN